MTDGGTSRRGLGPPGCNRQRSLVFRLRADEIVEPTARKAARMVTSACMVSRVKLVHVRLTSSGCTLNRRRSGFDITVVISGIGRNRVLVEWVTEVRSDERVTGYDVPANTRRR
jgi:hypothetical protein